MKIIKQGDLSRLHNPKHFKCYSCGCEFEADDTEYEDTMGPCGYGYFCYCPCCKRECVIPA